MLGILYVSLITDGVFLALHLPRRHVKHKNLSFDPEKLSVLIACYNGEENIGETIENALKKAKKENIIVASDASTDNTVEIAKSYGVKVLDYKENLNKAFTISRAIKHVKTPYVLILDDDTLIGNTFIPTSLLDEGYSAVAFCVMPVKTKSLLNHFQRFEYRKSMYLGKGLRGSVGGVGNVSGAIGLYRTQDLIDQINLHSGQYGGEDQQRTMLVHLYSSGKGVTYIDSEVQTYVPDNFKSLTKQRSKSWNLSCQELFVVYLRVVLSSKAPYILKIDRAYQMYIVLTDPIRMIFIWMIIFYPMHAMITLAYYVILGLVSWVKTGMKDKLWVVLTFPFYSKYLALCRFYAYFHWYKVKYDYLVRKRLHKRVSGRKLALEYAFIASVFFITWMLAIRLLYIDIRELSLTSSVSLSFIQNNDLISYIRR